MKLPLIALAAIAAALVSAPTQAQPGTVTMQFDTADARMSSAGYSPVDEIVRGTLAQGADEEFELDLDASSSYVVVAYCDGRCTDVDLVLSDDEGEEVDSDLAADDYPVVAVQGRGGTFVLTVRMATCSADECHYGVRVYRQ